MTTVDIPANLFAHRTYIQSDPASGLLSTAYGKRLIAVPELLMEAIYQTLTEEAGQASFLALYTFGTGWGKSFFERTRREIEAYYRTSIGQMNAHEFFATVQELWATHGLGIIVVNFAGASRGILQVSITNSVISRFDSPLTSKSFSLEAGFLAAWFSALTHEGLRACATSWDGATKKVEFLLGVIADIEKIEDEFVSKGMTTQEILRSIC